MNDAVLTDRREHTRVLLREAGLPGPEIDALTDAGVVACGWQPPDAMS